MRSTPENFPWRQFLCRACGLIYDESEGDPDSGIPPGTRFEDLPDDWACPLCGVTKDDFEPYTSSNPPVSPSRDAAPHRPAEQGIVIIGAGIAGWSTAQALRALDSRVPITLVSACPANRYHKPELSIALSRGQAPQALIRETGLHSAKRLGISLWPETHVIGISPELRQLRTTHGTLHYSKLILAQGARPSLPANFPAKLCWRVNHLSDWAGLHTRLQGAKRRIVIVGAGMVGCELADDCARAGHDVTLLGVNKNPLGTLLPEAAALRLRASLSELGVKFVGPVRVSKISGTPNGTKQVLTDIAGVFEANEIVTATGLATETRLARHAGLAFDRGIAVDPHTLQTSQAGIYALGDCISIAGAPCRFIEPIPRQAEVIAHAVLGRAHASYVHSAPVIRLKTRSCPIVLYGVPQQTGAWRIIDNTPQTLHMEQSHAGAVVARLQVIQTTPTQSH